MSEDWKHYTPEELSQLLGISTEKFHREVKKLIKRDFKTELRALEIDNPDIFLNRDNHIRLVDPRNHSNYYDTNLDINLYI